MDSTHAYQLFSNLLGNAVKYNLDQDLDDILGEFKAWREGREMQHPYAFIVSRSQISAPDFSLNPVHYLPEFEESRNKQTNHDLRGSLIRPIFGLTQLPFDFLRFPQAFMIWLNDAVFGSSGES